MQPLGQDLSNKKLTCGALVHRKLALVHEDLLQKLVREIKAMQEKEVK
jgi:hypothetical protein